MSMLLLDEEPLVISRSLAILIGLNESIVLQQIHYWLKQNEKSKRNFRDGHFWTYNSYPEWQKQFPFWSESTVKRAITKLEKEGYLISGNYNKLKIDRTKWYRINYEMLQPSVNSPLCQNDPMEGSNCADGKGQYDPTNTIEYPVTTPKNSFYVSEKRLHALTGENVFLDFYLKTHEHFLGKKHVRVTDEQENYINHCISKIVNTYDIELETWQEEVVNHFENLPKSNNGNILAFLKASHRYFEIRLDDL